MIIFLSEVNENVGEIDIFFLHFLMMTSTLLSLSCAYEYLHCFEYFVSSTHVTVDKMLVVDLQKPMITLVLLK